MTFPDDILVPPFAYSWCSRYPIHIVAFLRTFHTSSCAGVTLSYGTIHDVSSVRICASMHFFFISFSFCLCFLCHVPSSDALILPSPSLSFVCYIFYALFLHFTHHFTLPHFSHTTILSPLHTHMASLPHSCTHAIICVFHSHWQHGSPLLHTLYLPTYPSKPLSSPL